VLTIDNVSQSATNRVHQLQKFDPAAAKKESLNSSTDQKLSSIIVLNVSDIAFPHGVIVFQNKL